MSTTPRPDLPRSGLAEADPADHDSTCAEGQPDSSAAVAPYTQLIGQIVDRFAEVTTASTRLRMLLHESAAIVEELSLPSLHRRVVGAVGRLMEVQAAALAVLSPAGVAVQLVQQDDDVEVAGSVPLDADLAESLTSMLQPLPPMTVSRLGPDRSGALPAPWSAGFAAVPAHHRRTVLAVLLVAEPEGGLSTEDEDLLLSLAASAGNAIENARLYEEARRRQEWLREAAELTGGRLPVGTEEDAVRLVAHSVRKVADAELVAAWVPDGEGLRLSVALGDGAASLASLDLRLDDRMVREVATGARGAHLDVTDRPGSAWLEAVAAAGIGPVLTLPLLGGPGLRGLLLVGRNRGRPSFVDVDLDMAETFAGYVRMALDLMRARAAQERMAQLEDRERIARDLHHHVTSSLLSTGLKVQSAVGFSPDARIHSRLQEVVEDIDEILHWLRSAIFPLDEPAVPTLGEFRIATA